MFYLLPGAGAVLCAQCRTPMERAGDGYWCAGCGEYVDARAVERSLALALADLVAALDLRAVCAAGRVAEVQVSG